MLSIIIPALNEQQYLPSLLSSIIRQSPSVEHEIVIADAGSQDKTVEIALSYGCTVVPGGLAAKGRNQGGKAAKGDLFLFLDPEVLLPNGFLQRILSEFKERNLDIASCAIEPIVEKWMPRFAFPGFFFDLLYNWPARLSQSVFPYASALLLVKKGIHEKLGGFNESIRIGEDHDYARRGARFGRYGFLTSSKLPLFMRRCQKMGVLRTNLRYLLCNLFNSLLGEVKSDVFRYNFGQYKGISSEEGKDRRPNFALLPAWAIAYYILLMFGLLSWIVFFLVLVSKLIFGRVGRLIARGVLTTHFRAISARYVRLERPAMIRIGTFLRRKSHASLPKLAVTNERAIRWLLFCGIAAFLVLTIFVTAAVLLAPDYSRWLEPISQLGAQGRPHAEVMNAGFIIIGLLISGFAYGLYCHLGRCILAKMVWLLLAVSSIGIILLGIFQADWKALGVTGTLEGNLHTVFAQVTFIAFLTCMAIFTRLAYRNPSWRDFTRVSLAFFLANLVLLALLDAQVSWAGQGVLEFSFMGLSLVWLVAVSLRSLRLLAHASLQQSP